MRVAKGAEEARRTVLRRVPPAEAELPPAVRDHIRRVFGAELGVPEVVERILRDVREGGDEAVLRYNREVDGVPPELDLPLEVGRDEIRSAYDQVEGELVDALRAASERILAFHRRQMEHAMRGFREAGIGQEVRAIERVGMYVPGTTAVYPSTVLMTAGPARAAGVRELFMVTPVLPDGYVSPLKLVAAEIGGVDRVFRAGGVQGIAALTYGTQTVPAVDKICGPGNVFVTEAKRQVYGSVGLDGVFGPSETLVVADGTADPALVAADLLAGAEHDELATAILISTSEELAHEALAALATQIDDIDRAEVARTSLEAQGGVAIVETIDEALALANEFAPEHLCLHVADAESLIERVTNAGAVFAGPASVESVGDYTAGPSHVMPTGGSACFASPLGVHDFLKATSVISLDRAALDELAPPAARIARAEGFIGHARSIERRLEGDGGDA